MLFTVEEVLRAQIHELRRENDHLRAIVKRHACQRCGGDGGVYPTPLQRLGGWKGKLCPTCRAVNPDGEYDHAETKTT